MSLLSCQFRYILLFICLILAGAHAHAATVSLFGPHKIERGTDLKSEC